MSGSGIHSSGEEFTLTERTYLGDHLEDSTVGSQKQVDLIEANLKVAM